MAALATMAAATPLADEEMTDEISEMTTECPAGSYDHLTFSEQYSDMLRLWDHNDGNQDGFLTSEELRDSFSWMVFYEEEWTKILEEYECQDLVRTPRFLVDNWIINENYDSRDGVTYEYLDMFVQTNLYLKVPQSEIRRVFDTYGTASGDPDFLPVDSLEEFWHDWMYGEFVFSEVPASKYSRRYR